MASITTADFRNGMGLKIKDKYYTIVEFQHVKPGKGGAFVRYKTKDLKTGRVVENTCNAGSKFESVQLITNEMQYLYNDGDNYYFMDMTSYEQIAVPADFIGDNAKWLRENDNAQLLYADTELLGVNPPMFIEAEVIETVPGAKGQHRPGCHQARHHRHRCGRSGPHVPQRGRAHQGRHPHRRVRPAPLIAPYSRTQSDGPHTGRPQHAKE